MTIAVMTRASLGHTGRALTAGTGTTGIYALIMAAAVLRLVAPLGGAGHLLLSLSGAAWTGAFGLFVLIYAPLLLSPRGTNEAMVTRTTRASRIQVKRAYLRPAPEDGMRVLVDRLWPRGMSKSDSKIDRWMKELAPSSELRRWFGHDPSRWEEFRRRYEAELSDKPELLDELREIAREKPLTLVFGARDERHNQAIVLKDLISR